MRISEADMRSDSISLDASLLEWEAFFGSGIYGANQALRLSAVYRSVALIAETVATMPFNLLKTDGKSKELAEQHRNFDLFASEPNQFQTWFDFWLHIVSQTLQHGNGYAYIKRDRNGFIESLQPLSTEECVPYYLRDRNNHFLYYYIFGEITDPRDVIHIRCLGSNGVIGLSPLAVADQAIKSGLGQQDLNNSIYKNGLNLSGVLETPETLSDAATMKLKKSMDAFRGAKNGNGVMVLEGGLQYKPMFMTPSDAQLLETRKFTIEEIGRFYGVPLHKIGMLDKATYSNIEQQDLEFFKGTISNWIERIEQEFNRKFLLPKEKRYYKHEFDINRLLRTDTKARAENLRVLFNIGAVTPNEARLDSGRNPINEEYMNKTYMQLNMSDLENLETNNGSNGKGNSEPSVPSGAEA